MKNEWTPKQVKLMKFLLGLFAVVVVLGILGRVVGEDGPPEPEASGLSGYCGGEPGVGCEEIPAEHENAAWADWYRNEGGNMSLYISIWAPTFVPGPQDNPEETHCDVLQDLFDGAMEGWDNNYARGTHDLGRYFLKTSLAVATRGDQMGCANFTGMAEF